MKVIAMIPFWSNYQPSLRGLSCLPLVNIGGKHLICRTVELINQINLIDEVVIFASDDKVMSYIDDNVPCSFLRRDKSLDSDSTSIEDIIESFITKTSADVIVLVHPKSPFIKPETIEDCLHQVLSSNYDSAFTARSIRKHAWYRGKPLNYSRAHDTPALSIIEPVIIETSSVYVFTSKLFNNNRKRIGENPFIKEIGHFEGFEIEREDDYTMAELIINAGLDRERS